MSDCSHTFIAKMLAVVLIAACLLNLGLAEQFVDVQIDTGIVRGHFIQDTFTDAEYYAFKCIPFGQPPVGRLRFSPPVKASKWKGVLDTQTCTGCPQVNFTLGDYEQDEDCLKINVFTRINPKDAVKNEPLPVVAYIVAGEWRQENADDYSPSYFLEKQQDKSVVLVTFNYRLGPFGFLSTGDSVVPGNNGLKDQVLALEWIRDNIASFGGDASKVTLYGSSAGAASVRFHMLSPKSKGLFVGAIAQSGNELNPISWQSKAEAANLFNKLAEDLGCQSGNKRAIVDCLRKQSPQKILESETAALEEEYYHHLFTTFKPVTELESKDAFLTKDPVDLLNGGDANVVPLIIGMVAKEGAYKYVEYSSRGNIEDLKNNLDWLIPTSSSLWKLQSKFNKEIADKLRTDYSIYDADKDRDNLIDLISDTQYLIGHNKVVSTLLKQNYAAPIYQYVYNYVSKAISWTLYHNPYNFGPGHYDDELMLFDPRHHFLDYKRTPEDKAISKVMVSMYINFAYNQNPNIPGMTWNPVTINSNQYLNITSPSELTMERNFEEERDAYWNILMDHYRTIN